MEHLSNDHKDHPNQHESSHKLCDETGHHGGRNQWGISGGITELEGIIYNLNWYLLLLLHFYIFCAFWANQIKRVVKWSLKITEIKPIAKKSWENGKTKEAKKIKPSNFIHEKYSKVARNHKTRLEPLNSQ